MAFESNHLSFHVHRSTRAAGDYVRVSGEPIEPPPPYEFIDTDAMPGTTYFYRLQAVDLAGDSEFFGPISARFDVGRLAQSRPNPFPPGSPFTQIQFNVAANTEEGVLGPTPLGTGVLRGIERQRDRRGD